MFEILVAGVLALDDLKTPKRSEKGIVGGAGVYSSISSSIFAETALVAAIGNDFPESIIDKIRDRRINIESVKKLDYPTFHWSGEYVGDMSQAITHDTEFTINEYYTWDIIEKHRNPTILLLCNNDPNIQLRILEQVNAKTVAMDTMNLWIDINRDKLDSVVSKVNILFINDAEARQYSRFENLGEAANCLLEKGPEYVIIKKGEHGASLYSKERETHLKAFAVNDFVDPTGAGDSFAGGFMGYLSTINTSNEKEFKNACIYGTVMASFCVEDFGINKTVNLSEEEIESRKNLLLNQIKI